MLEMVTGIDGLNPRATPRALNENVAPAGQAGDLRPGVDLLHGYVPIAELKEIGRASPSDAFQSVVWAAVHGDPSLPGRLFLNEAARIEADQIVAGLPASQQAQFDTPEKLAALYVNAKLDGIDTLEIIGVKLLDPETAEISVLSGEAGLNPSTFSMQATPTGWRLKISPGKLSNFQNFLRAQAG